MGTRRAWPRVIRRALAVGVMVAATVAAGPGAGTAGAAAGEVDTGEPTSISVTPSTGLADGQRVDVTVDGTTGVMWLSQCDARVTEDSPVEELLDYCGNEYAVVAGTRPVTTPYVIRAQFTTTGGRYVACAGRTGGCVLTVTGQQGQGLKRASIEVVPGPLTVHVTPSASLAPVDDVAVTVTGARATTHYLSLCDASVAATRTVPGGPCGPIAEIRPGTAPHEATMTVERTYLDAGGRSVRCQPDRCVVAVSDDDGTAFVSTPVAFRSAPDLQLIPAAGLVDGQEVAVTAVDVPPSYLGPPFWVFPTTGNWLLAQCHRQVGPSLLSVFENCAVVPGGGAVEVPDAPTADLGMVAVRSSITSGLGRVTDCTTGVGMCVLAIARVEDGGAVSLGTTPLAFG